MTAIDGMACATPGYDNRGQPGLNSEWRKHHVQTDWIETRRSCYMWHRFLSAIISHAVWLYSRF